MSFGFAVGDFISAGSLAWDLYTKCYLVIQDAPQEFRDLVDSLSSVRIAMRSLEEEVKNPNSALSHAGEDRVRNIVSMVGAITRTLEVVEKLVNRYQVIVEPKGDLRSYGRRLWSKIKWSTEVNTIQDLRLKLLFYTNIVNLYLMTIGNSSLGRIEAIMIMLVASISPGIHAEMNATTNELENTSLHLTSHELSVNSNDSADADPGARFRNSVSGSEHLQELPGNGREVAESSGVGQYQAVGLPGRDQNQPAGLPVPHLHKWQITAEESAAAGEILAEAEQKLLQHGRSVVPPSLGNSIKTNLIRPEPLPKIPREPIPTSSVKSPSPSLSAEFTESPKQTQTPGMNSVSGYPPQLPEKVTISPQPTQSGAIPISGTLGSSVNYLPSDVVEKAFLTFKSIYVNTKGWPSDITTWVRIAEWWFLKGELSREEHQGLTHQAYVNFAKCSWILGQIVQRADGFNYDVSEKDELHYSGLLKGIELDYKNQDLDTGIPISSLDLYGLALELLEPTQPEEEYGLPTYQKSSFLSEIAKENNVIFRSFVAVEFGISRPSRPAADIARSYLLLLHLNPDNQSSWIFIYNQTGTLRIVKSLDRNNVGPGLDGSNIRNWIGFEFDGQSAYAGFSSTDAAVPYAVEYNRVRRVLLEKPACIFEITVEKARYIAEGHEVNPVGIGPASLALMEMNKAEYEYCHYREIIMRGHFTTKEIPLHVIKITQSPSSPIRVQLWWPTFDLPPEDIRRYLRGDFYKGMDKRLTSGDFFINPHLREFYSGYSGITFPWVKGFFVEIQYRPIEERLLDIDVRIQSDRMLDIIFRTPGDAREFIMHAGGMAPRIIEKPVFQKVTPEKEFRIFRMANGTIRLCYKESDIYCNFITDEFSSYNITTEGSTSLWSIMWSPFGSIQRVDNSYLTDSVDLGVLEPRGFGAYTIITSAERNQLIAALVFPEMQLQCASMKIRNFAGVRGGVIGRVAKALGNLRVSAKEAMLVLTGSDGAIKEVTVFGKLIYEDYSRPGEVMRLMAKVVTIKEGRPDSSKGKLSIHLSVVNPRLHTYNRERSLAKQAREPQMVESEIGELQFTVDDVPAWRAAFTNLAFSRNMTEIIT